MKKINIITLLILLLILIDPLKSQNYEFTIGATGSYFQPIGSLADRFKPTYGGSFTFGRAINKTVEWYAKAEYFKFEKVNEEKAIITRDLTFNDVKKTYTMPLPNLEMSLEVIGLSANVNFKVIDTDFFDGNITGGFGIFRWIGKRGAYYDSLMVDTTGNGDFTLGQVVGVPSIDQNDWSGGFNVGLDANIKITGPVWFNIAGNYKVVVGELWPSLSLDIENVSTFQMIEARAGIKIRF